MKKTFLLAAILGILYPARIWSLTSEYVRAEQAFDNPGTTPQAFYDRIPSLSVGSSAKETFYTVSGRKNKRSQKPKDPYEGCPDWTKPGHSSDIGLPNVLPLIGGFCLILGLAMGGLAAWAAATGYVGSAIGLGLWASVWLGFAIAAYYHNHKINQCLHRGHNHSTSRSSSGSQPNLNEPNNNWP